MDCEIEKNKVSKKASYGKAFKAAFPYTIPVMTGYLFIGMAFGVMIQEKGYNFLWAILMSVLCYAGSGQYLAVNFFAPGGVFKMSNGIMDNTGDAKYGFTHEQIIEGFKILKEKGAKHFGVHAFLASNTVTNEYYPKLARQLFELVVELRDKTGCDIQFINLSGGVGVPYTPDQTPNDIRVIGQGVKEAFEEILVPAGLGNISIYTEMGRFMLAPYGCLVTKAIHEKHTYKEYIGVDACAVNLMRPAIYGAYHHITVMGKEDEPCDHKYDVTGSLCENCDKFAIDRMLPKIDMGDLLVIHDAGAHGFSMGYNYNGKLRSAEVLLKEDGSTQLIRRAETPDDYFRTFDCFDILKDMKHPERK